MESISMTQDEAIALFGTRKEAQKALGYKSSQAFSMWPPVIKGRRALAVIGAAFVAGKEIPDKYRAAA